MTLRKNLLTSPNIVTETDTEMFTPLGGPPSTQRVVDKAVWSLDNAHFSVILFVFCRLLGRGTMFVFSTTQLQKLLGSSIAEREAGEERRLLDLGAGDGGVTAHMAPLFDTVSVTEMSPLMRRALAKRGFE